MPTIDAGILLGRVRESLPSGQLTDESVMAAANRAVAELPQLPSTPGEARRLLGELLDTEHPAYAGLFAQMSCGSRNVHSALVTALTEVVLTPAASTHAA